MKKLVVKIGSSTLTTAQGKADYAYLESLVKQIAAIRAEGWQPVIVSSAAIACGLEALGITQRPSDMPSLQAAASVGQNVLSAAYAKAFASFDILTSLVLLTRRDTADRNAYLHARDTFLRLLDLGVVPVVNENDTVSVEQIRFGDNDTLAALVACLIDADLVVILSDVEGLFDKDPTANHDARIIPLVEAIDAALMGSATGARTTIGSGGMITKLTAARVLMAAGIETAICSGRRPQVLIDLIKGEPLGTRFLAKEKPHEITPKKLWIALGDSTRGALTVDDGAKTALVAKGGSLLCVGLASVQGSFDRGDIIDIKDLQGHVFARGKVAASSDELDLACGLSGKALKANRLLSPLATKPVIHRDDLVVFE
ncbi:MAG: glutamate 5-kinase [Coriobacteriaceae bacterium]|nr:glutamate 5-kinase [Coriobacteriaceae bacterium]